MYNTMTLTGFIRHLKEQSLGYATIWLVPEGKSYTGTVNALAAIAAREQIKIGTNQCLIVDPSTVTAISAIKVTRK